MSTLPSFQDMPLWQRSMQLAVEVCQLCMQLPGGDKLVVSANLQEATLAIPTTLARGSKAGKAGFTASLSSAKQTAAEVETLIIVMQNIYNDNAFTTLHDRTIELQNALEAMSQRLRGGTATSSSERMPQPATRPRSVSS